MKLGILLAANVLIAGAAILAYDVTRPAAPSAPQTADGETIDLTGIEERLGDLERRLDGFSTIHSDRKTTSRLLQIEHRLASMETGATPATTASIAPTEADAAGALSAVDAESDDAGELAPTDIATIKKAMKQIDRDRDRQRASRGVDRMIDRLGLQLSGDQKVRLGEEFTTFRGKIRDNIRNGRMEGQTRDDRVANMETLREDFGTSLGAFLSATDAEAIVSEIGDNMGGGGRRGPGRRGGGAR